MRYIFKGIGNVKTGRTYYVTKRKYYNIHIRSCSAKHIPIDDIIHFTGPHFKKTDTIVMKEAKVLEEIAISIANKQNFKKYEDAWDRFISNDILIYTVNTSFSYDKRIVEAQNFIIANVDIIPSEDFEEIEELKHTHILQKKTKSTYYVLEEIDQPIIKKCPLCGASFTTFQYKGKFVCEPCYRKIMQKRKTGVYV